MRGAIIGVLFWSAVAVAQHGFSTYFADLSAFTDDHGAWEVVSAVAMDPLDPKALVSAPGLGTAFNGPSGNTKNLVSKEEHGDTTLHVEFMVPSGSNSGVYLMGRYEIQIFDSWGVAEPQHSDCGGIYQRWRDEAGVPEDKRGYEGRAPKVNASRPPGLWQSLDIEFKAPEFDESGTKIANAEFLTVRLNGIMIHMNEKLSGPTRAALFGDEKPTGPLMLQGDHGPVAFRNLRMGALEEEAGDGDSKIDF